MCEKNIEQCSVGKVNKSECHKLSYTKQTQLIDISNLDQGEVFLITLRSGVSEELFKNICEHHKVFYLKKYEVHQTSCMDPFKSHKKKITKCLRAISLELSEKINNIEECHKAVPGQKICDVCRDKVNKHEILHCSGQNSDPEVVSDEEINQLQSSISKQNTLEDLNTSFKSIGESPLKLHALSSHSKSAYAKRKIESASSNLKSKIVKVLETDYNTDDEPQISNETETKAKDLDRLIELMKIKLNVTNKKREQIQILTLVPASWSRKKICQVFNVSEYTARKATELVRDKGLLAQPEPRKGKSLDENVITLVKMFYQNEEYSRVMPGAKDKVSISKNNYMQKRLLLANLNELYSAFKFEHPYIKIGFSKFCMLRPKWCVLAGASGTHSVCVCTIHQNVSLLLHACSIEEHYNDLIDKLVCSRLNRDCVLRHCTKCPSSDSLKTFIKEKFEEWDPDDEVTYSAWVTTDRTQQVHYTVTFEEYLETLIKHLELLIPHSFITKSQANYLKEYKVNLKSNQAVVLLDFSENYSYVLQNEAQGYHWTRNSCSLHPAVIYARADNGELVVSSLCIVSDDLEHDVPFVYETQRVVVQYIKDKFPKVQELLYYSDGCAAQYKNCKNFINLCNHENDFKLSATWGFFATSHGKSPCDGIGGTVKRLVAKASLQMTPGNAIDNVQKFFEYCNTKIENIHFSLISQKIILESRKSLNDRFSKAKTVPGTRSFHHFIPKSKDQIATKRVSSDGNFCTIFDFSNELPSLRMIDISINNYIVCIYDDHWYYGLVLDKDELECDIQVKFLHPHGPAKSFFWPSREDICWIPMCNIMSRVNPPVTKGSGRMYYFPEDEIQSTDILCKKMLKQTSTQKQN